MIIGICGKSGSGKSTLANKIKQCNKNTVILDIDKVGHQALLDSQVKENLIDHYGEKIITDHKVDRKKLSTIVFNSKYEMDFLTSITWKFMEKEINNFINNNKDKNIILDWQLLPKTDFFNMCNIKILLDTPYKIRKKRAMIRDNITETEFDIREKASYEYNKKLFDYIINDDFNEIIDILEKQL